MSVGPIIAFTGQHRFLSNFWQDGPLTVDLSDVTDDLRPGAGEEPEMMLTEPLTGASVEHVFQAAKPGRWGQRQYQLAVGSPVGDRQAQVETILRADKPQAAKLMGKSVSPLRTDWEQVKVPIMLACLRAKFAPGRGLENELLGTGYRMLVEGNTWGDTTWGAVTMARAAAKRQGLPVWARVGPGDREALAGRNLLGRLLMLVRAELDCGLRGEMA